MPIYEFQCEKCHRLEEKIMKISDPVPTDCVHCGSSGTLKKLMSKTSFVLKGSGWYETDFKTPSNSSSSSATSKKDDTSTKSSGSSEESPTSSESKKEASQTSSDKPAHSCASGCAH